MCGRRQMRAPKFASRRVRGIWICVGRQYRVLPHVQRNRAAAPAADSVLKQATDRDGDDVAGRGKVLREFQPDVDQRRSAQAGDIRY